MGLVSVFIDISKAYDWIDRELLQDTLRLYGFPDKILQLIR